MKFALLLLVCSGALAVDYTITLGTKSASHPFYGRGNETALLVNGVEGATIHATRGVALSLQVNVPCDHALAFGYLAIGGRAGILPRAGLFEEYFSPALNRATPNLCNSAAVTWTPGARTPQHLYYISTEDAYAGGHVIVSGDSPCPFYANSTVCNVTTSACRNATHYFLEESTQRPPYDCQYQIFTYCFPGGIFAGDPGCHSTSIGSASGWFFDNTVINNTIDQPPSPFYDYECLFDVGTEGCKRAIRDYCTANPTKTACIGIKRQDMLFFLNDTDLLSPAYDLYTIYQAHGQANWLNTRYGWSLGDDPTIAHLRALESVDAYCWDRRNDPACTNWDCHFWANTTICEIGSPVCSRATSTFYQSEALTEMTSCEQAMLDHCCGKYSDLSTNPQIYADPDCLVHHDVINKCFIPEEGDLCVDAFKPWAINETLRELSMAHDPGMPPFHPCRWQEAFHCFDGVGDFFQAPMSDSCYELIWKWCDVESNDPGCLACPVKSFCYHPECYPFDSFESANETCRNLFRDYCIANFSSDPDCATVMDCLGTFNGTAPITCGICNVSTVVWEACPYADSNICNVTCQCMDSQSITVECQTSISAYCITDDGKIDPGCYTDPQDTKKDDPAATTPPPRAVENNPALLTVLALVALIVIVIAIAVIQEAKPPTAIGPLAPPEPAKLPLCRRILSQYRWIAPAWACNRTTTFGPSRRWTSIGFYTLTLLALAMGLRYFGLVALVSGSGDGGGLFDLLVTGAMCAGGATLLDLVVEWLFRHIKKSAPAATNINININNINVNAAPEPIELADDIEHGQTAAKNDDDDDDDDIGATPAGEDEHESDKDDEEDEDDEKDEDESASQASEDKEQDDKSADAGQVDDDDDDDDPEAALKELEETDHKTLVIKRPMELSRAWLGVPWFLFVAMAAGDVLLALFVAAMYSDGQMMAMLFGTAIGLEATRAPMCYFSGRSVPS